MKYSYILFTLLALILAASPARAAYIDLGLAGNYNAFIFNDFSNSYSDTEGRLAVGGNATMTGYGVGVSLPAGYTGDSLVVGGNLAYDNGQVDHGDVVVGGSKGTSSVNVVDGVLYDNAILPFDFATEAAYLKNLSLTLSGAGTNGTVDDSWGILTLVGDNSSGLQVFNLDADTLFNANTMYFNQIAAGATVLINVSGTNPEVTNMGVSTLDGYSSNILFNFYEAETLTLNNSTKGSILAPFADVTGGWYHINGTLIASSFDGHIEQHNTPFDGGTPVPEPGTFLIMGAGLLGLAAFMRRRGRGSNA